MKKCTYYGKEYSDETDVCPLDGNPFQHVIALIQHSKKILSWLVKDFVAKEALSQND